MKHKIMWYSLFIGVITVNGFCLVRTLPVIVEPAKVTACQNWCFNKYALGYDAAGSKIDITVMDPADPTKTAVKSILFTQKTKMIEYIMSKLMNSYASNVVSVDFADLITFFQDNNIIIGIKFTSKGKYEASQYRFKSIAFFPSDGSDYVNITLVEGINDDSPITYSFNIDAVANAIDLDYVVGQFILLPSGDASEISYNVNVRAYSDPFRFEFDWSIPHVPPQRIK